MNRSTQGRNTINGKSAKFRVGSVCCTAIAASLLVVACDESVVGPGDTKVVARGDEVTTVWSIDGAKMSYMGATKGQITEKQSDSSITRTFARSRPITLSTSEIEKSRLAVEPKALSLSLRVMRAMYPSAENSQTGRDTSKTIFRPSLGQRSERWRSPEGHDISWQTLTDKHSGRGIIAMLIYVDGRATSLTEFGYQKKSGKWRTSRMRSTLFDARGRPTKLLDVDMSKVETVRPNVAALITPSAGKTFAWLGAELKAIALPDAAYAATIDNLGGNCYWEWAEASAKTALAGALAGGAIIAAAECGTIVAAVVACPALIAALDAYKHAIDAAKEAAQRLAACRAAHGDCFDEYRGIADSRILPLRLDCSPEGGASGPGGGHIDCEWYTYEISYDGGLTWERYGEPFQICADMT